MSAEARQQDGSPNLRWLGFQILWASGSMALIGATWRLWTPQRVFPQVPLISAAAEVSEWCDWATFFAGGFAAFVCFATAVRRVYVAKTHGHQDALPAVTVRPIRAAVLFSVAMFAAMLIDQHRIQPWAFQFAICGIVLATCSAQHGLCLLRVLAISIYLFSSLGKFDYQFVHTVGQQMLSAGLQWLTIDVSKWSESARLWGAVCLPFGELILVPMLSVPRLRRCGVAAAIGLHGALLMILGPWGLNHESAVLLWNIFFIGQAVLLFWPDRFQRRSVARTGWRFSERAAAAVVIAAVAAPCLEGFGAFDHWPSWGLYSPRNSRAVIQILGDKREADRRWNEMPAAARPYLVVRDGQLEHKIDISRWSLECLGVPVYPQDRYQLGVAIAIAEAYPGDIPIQVTLQGMSHRLNGTRSRSVFIGETNVSSAARRFRLNAKPNSRFGR